MAVRTDLTVDWEVSPRIITVASPSTSITIQELHDAVTTIEQSVGGIDFLKLIESTGKDDLGDGVTTGITAVLQDAKIAFEARGGPSFVSCRISGGNLGAVDSNGDSIDPIQTTAYVQVTLAQSTAPIELPGLADAVWDESSSEHTTLGTLSKDLQDAKDAAELAFLNSL